MPIKVLGHPEKVFIKDTTTGKISYLGEPATITEETESVNEIIASPSFEVNPLILSVPLSSSTKALYYFLAYGNDLYLKFPKKLRRKKIKW